MKEKTFLEKCSEFEEVFNHIKDATIPEIILKTMFYEILGEHYTKNEKVDKLYESQETRINNMWKKKVKDAINKCIENSKNIDVDDVHTAYDKDLIWLNDLKKELGLD